MPGYEGCSYGSWKEIVYNLRARKKVIDKTKKWLISSFQPLSTKVIRKLVKQKYELPYKHCDKIIVFTESYVNRFRDIVGEREGHKEVFSVFPNPTSFSTFLSENELKSKAKEVLYVGRLYEPQKRVSMALKIWKMVEENASLDEWSFHIVGLGEGEEFLRWMVRKSNLKRVHFEGQQDPRPYYRRASILLSTSSYEGWPMVLMEAMPMGCCCMAFDSYEAVHDIIDDGLNGCVVKNNDLKGYYKRLEDLMTSDDKRFNMGLQAVESSKRFSMEVVAARWHRFFEGLCGQ